MSTTVASSPDSILESLMRHKALGEAPQHELEWLASNGTLLLYEMNEVVTMKGQHAPAMLIVFSGHLVIRVDRGAGSHKIIEWKDGDVGGTMPYSRGAIPPNDVIAEEQTRLLSIRKELFGDVTRECPTVTATLVHLLLDRARQFRSSDLRDEKLISLGKLAAGFAHELNNPATAVISNARQLKTSIAEAARATRELGSLRLADSQLDAIADLRDVCMTRPAPAGLSSIDRAEREDAIDEWLATHGVDPSRGAPLADTALTIADLDALAAQVGGETLDVGLRWLASDCMMRSLVTDIESAAVRIRGLVDTVKSFSYMDRALSAEPVELAKGISESVALLEPKRREKNIAVLVDVPGDVPAVMLAGA